MNSTIKTVLGALLLMGVGAAGYWFGTHNRIEDRGSRIETKAERKVLYYRNPMGLSDTSSVPKKDSMGMDYVAVYEGDDTSTTQINIGMDKVQKLGVKSEPATMRELKQTLRATGRIEIDERRTYTIAPKFEGWVEKLHVNTTGQFVSKGQALFDVYSPELVSAQREQTLAVKGLKAMQGADDEAKQGMQRLADGSANRLKNWGITDAPVDSEDQPSPQSSPASGRGSEREKQYKNSGVTFRSPITGIVLEKKVVQGLRFMPGEMLYQLADLSSVWAIAEVPEQDIAQVQLGGHAQVIVDAYPDRTFDGKVDFIYPTLNSATRTVQVRMEINNPKGLLKPAMFASAQIAVGKVEKVLAVPASAVIDSGTRQVVLVRLSEGRFEPRTVSLGKRSNEYVEVLAGIAEGEQVVTSANFLIDSESNLKAALGNLKELPPPPTVAPKPTTVAQDHSAHTTESSPKKKPKVVGHVAQGVLEGINDDGSVSITHEPIKSLGWPGMTMDFALANSSLVDGIAPGSAISFEIVERKPDEWVITKINSLPFKGRAGVGMGETP